MQVFHSALRLISIAFVFATSFTLSANICFELPPFESNDFTFDDRIEIESFDNVRLSANLFTPKMASPASGYPAIIFANSWVVDEHEYLIQAAQFAKKGYLVLSYSTRGWGCSGGQVNVVGDKDMTDLSYLVDWLIANTNVDADNIGISGISYGSGISLMGLATEPRIKTAVAMSTWGSLTQSLYQAETPRLFWGFFLVSSGYITANMDPIIFENYLNLVFNDNIDSTTAWADQRSVVNLVEQINQRQAPVYLANNFGDNLFQPNNLLDFYSKLTGPKRLDLNQGTHATGEGFGLVGLDNYTWNRTHEWFDYWLKGIDTQIMQKQPVTMEVDLTHQRDEFEQWPIENSQNRKLYFEPRGMFSSGGLSLNPYSPWWTRTNKIYSGLDTLATTGIPVLSALLGAHAKVPVKTPLSMVSKTNGIVFKSDTLSEAMKIRGIPKINLNVKPSRSQMQMIAYLYDIAPNGIGTLITHGPVTRYDAQAGAVNQIDWELVATAYDIPAGHKLGIAIDTFDILYAVPTIAPYSLKFYFDDGVDSWIDIPTL